jgi:hypothetical protein
MTFSDKKMKVLFVLLLLFPFTSTFGLVRHVGTQQPYPNLQSAANVSHPGDTILFHAGTYPGGEYISGLQGTDSNWITILAENQGGVIIQGGSNAWQLSDPAYIKIEGFVFQGQTGNGVNIDDAGSYNTPADRITISNCIFRDMNASGNNDLLKLSGVDHFKVEHCTFLNGASGGSGIDMVGCHNGIIEQNRFGNMGTNAIQMKGGSQYITVERNFFKHCGDRTLNLGGSTGLAYFRPQDATFEAADLNVYSNIFIGSEAPIAYVGSTRVKVVNNTFYLPERWVVRILQETVDPTRFIACGDNYFENNIIYQGNISTETNIGSNTRPQSFIYNNNFWYNYQNPSWAGPSIPVTDPGLIKNQDPQFTDISNDDFSIGTGSPATGIISGYTVPEHDYFENIFRNIRSAGAIEGNPIAAVVNLVDQTFDQYANDCIAALQHIVVAGDGNMVEFQSGSSVNLIAGQTLQLMPGTTIQEGANVHAYISTDGLFCDELKSTVTGTASFARNSDDSKNQRNVAEMPIGQCINVFPNPSNGKFTVKVDGVDHPVKIVIYNLPGAMVYQDVINTEKTIEISEVQPGLYFVKMISSNRSFIQKIVIK